MRKNILLCAFFMALSATAFCWGFYGHKKINNYAVFLLPPEMMVLYKPNLDYIIEHAVDPDKRRYALEAEAPRHYIDLDRYGSYPFPNLPRNWDEAVAKYSEDTLQAHGIVPWWVQIMLTRLTNAFKAKDQVKILKLSAEIGHYIADAHVPLHTTKNYNGQLTDQKGIHGFWESRVPELLADKNWDFFIGKAEYISNPGQYIWSRVEESAAAADSVLTIEKGLNNEFREDQKYAFENRNGTTIRQYSTAYAKAYDARLGGMIERRMRQSIYSVACFWYTAWVNAGQPDLKTLQNTKFNENDLKEFEELNVAWMNGKGKGREHE